MQFDNNLGNEIIQRADIVKIISSFVNVIKKGKDYVAICPFHDDTNPSMRISPEKKIFKCFACGAGGNVITFVQKFLHISYFDAIKKIGEMIGFDDPRLNKKVEVKKVDRKAETLLKCLKDLSLYYQYILNTPVGEEGLKYLKSRDITDEIIVKFKIGFAPADGKSTIAFLQSKGHSLKTIEDCGISTIVNGEYIDKNRGRCIFSLCDADGQVIGFSARKINNNDESPKYVNTSETYLFHKSSVLYNYHIAKNAARIANSLYICEGFMDVIALSKISMDNSVAVMGTALTSEHVSLLRKINVEIRICLDGDLAGQNATLKTIKILTNAGIIPLIVDSQNQKKDPDEILKQNGKEALKSNLSKLISKDDFLLNYFKNTNPLVTNEQKKSVIIEFLPTLLQIKSQLELDSIIHKLSQVTGYEEISIKNLLSKTRNTNSENTNLDFKKTVSTFHPERTILRKLTFAEREFLYQMINNPEAINFYENKVSNFVDEIYRSIANFILNYYSENKSIDPYNLLNALEQSDVNNKEELINELTDLCFDKTYPNECNEEYLNSLLNSMVKEKEKIFESDMLNQSMLGKDPLEQARILAEFNRKKLKK